jgi:hypothetical protein
MGVKVGSSLHVGRKIERLLEDNAEENIWT